MRSIFGRRVVLFIVVLFAVSGLVAGFLANAPSKVPLAYATACQQAHQSCAGGIKYRTAALDVSHVTQIGETLYPVEPDDGETWNITAYWNTAEVPCSEKSETASATVSWNGSGWTVSNVTTTGYITDIDVCDTDEYCDSVDSHAYGYRLIAKVYDPHTYYWNLRQVVFTTTSVDDGYILDTGSCELGDSVSATADTFSQTDSGAFECGYGCSNSGPSLQITYE